MDWSHFVQEYGFLSLVSLAVFAFLAGFVDAVIGGGGLIQLPALLINFPSTPLPILLGTTKVASLAGTSMAAAQYSRRIQFNYKLLLLVALFAGSAAFAGAKVVSHINVQALKPVILIILIVIAIYTYFKKDLGAVRTQKVAPNKQYVYGALLGTVIGFYDGFFGPGTGSFLVLGFVLVLGFEFLEASGYAKLINCITNLAALFVFIGSGSYLLGIAILMSICNVLGNFLGARMALKKGNGFVRVFFLIVVLMMIARYAYDIYSSPL
jgi:uncharacterized membrane protein YfcA